jgi:hypothetical protein
VGRVPAHLAFAALSSLLLFVSCGVKPPELSSIEWRVETRPSDKGTRYESLSVFASIKDESGLDNVETIWIVDDDDALAWKLTSADWTKPPQGSPDWIGGSSLATPDLGPVPRGKYRFVTIDAAGQRTELSFVVGGAFPAKKAPEISYAPSAGQLSVRSEWTETLVLAFDAAGVFLRSATAPDKAESLADLLGDDCAERTALVSAYGYEPAIKMGAFSQRIKTR